MFNTDIDLFCAMRRLSSTKEIVEIGFFRFLINFWKYEKQMKDIKLKELEKGLILVQHQCQYWKNEKKNHFKGIWFFYLLDSCEKRLKLLD